MSIPNGRDSSSAVIILVQPIGGLQNNQHITYLCPLNLTVGSHSAPNYIHQMDQVTSQLHDSIINTVCCISIIIKLHQMQQMRTIATEIDDPGHQSVCLSCGFMQHRCVHAAAWIKVLHGVETLGNVGKIVWNGDPDFPYGFNAAFNKLHGHNQNKFILLHTFSQ